LKDKDYDTNLLAKLVRPLDSFCASIGERVEKRRHTFTSWFKDRDFVRVPDFVAKLRPHAEQDPLSKYLYENLSAPTQRLVCAVGNEKLLPRKLARELNRLLEDSVYENARFQHVALSEYLADFIRENPQGHSRIRLNRLLLEAAYPNEIGRSL